MLYVYIYTTIYIYIYRERERKREGEREIVSVSDGAGEERFTFLGAVVSPVSFSRAVGRRETLEKNGEKKGGKSGPAAGPLISIRRRRRRLFAFFCAYYSYTPQSRKPAAVVFLIALDC